MQSTLFRLEALEHRRVTLVGAVLAERRLPFRLVTGLSVGAAIALVALGALGEYTRKVHVAGYLAPSAGLIRIYAGQAGTLVERQVQEGQRVRRGDVLYVLSTDRASPQTPQVQASATAAIRTRQAGLEREAQAERAVARLQVEGTRARLTALMAELEQVRLLSAMQQTRVNSAEGALLRYEKLRTDGFIALAGVDPKRNEVLDQRARLGELARAQAVLGRDISTLQQELASSSYKEAREQSRLAREAAQLAQEAIESESRRALSITAPADGVATAVLADNGQTMQAQSLLLTILPAGAPLQAKLLVPSRAIGSLALGDAVSLRYPAFPHQRYGSYQGRVTEIPRTTAAATETDAPLARSEPVYCVTVALDAQTIRTTRAEVPLQSGMLLEADVSIEKRRLVGWLFDPLLSVVAKL